MELRSNACVTDGRTKVWPIGTPEPDDGLSWGNRVGYTVFKKPDKPTTSPKVNGYRMPTPYSAGVSKVNVTAEIFGKGVISDYLNWKHQGTVVLWCSDLSALGEELNRNALRMKVLNNIRDEVLDVAMVLAEMQSTAGTISNNLLRIGRTLQAIKSRRPTHYDLLMHGRRPSNLRGKKLDKFNREVAGTYLEFKYGIMPIVYDIQGACKALDMNEKGSLFDNPPLLVARSSEKATDNRTLPFVGNARHFNVFSNVACTVQKELKARCDFRVDGEGLRGLNRYGLGLGTVATVLYDKTPFSFVLNMAFPLAELIKAWTALAGVQTISYCETSYVKIKIKSGSVTSSPYYGVASGSINPVGDIIRFTRVVYDRPPFPLPYVRNPIKVGNVATVLALFTQLRKR